MTKIVRRRGTEGALSTSARDRALESRTHWSRLLAHDVSDEEFGRTWNYFFERYRGALYGYFRRRGHSHDDSRDLLSEFFASALERGLLERASPERGRFRPYFFVAVDRFLTDHYRTAGRKKRQPGSPLQSIDRLDDCGQLMFEPEARDMRPDEAFDRDWANSLVRSCVERLKGWYEERQRPMDFEGFRLRTFEGLSTREIAQRTGLDPAGIDQLCNRARKKLREIVRQEVELTVKGDEVDDELRRLMALYETR